MDNVSSVLKQREVEQEITSILPPPPLPSASLPVFLSGFHHHWRHVHSIYEADKRGACGLRPDSFLTHERSTHLWLGVPPDSSSSHLLPARKWPRFSRLLDVFTYTAHWWHCQSTSIAHSSEERDAPTGTKAPIQLPSWWNSLQSLRSPAVLWLHAWWC